MNPVDTSLPERIGFGLLQSGVAAAGMFWVMLWALILGFALSGVVMAFVPKTRMVRALGRPGPRQIGLALFFGAVSSSCSYAAVAMARSLFQKGAHIIPALAFMLASTNLVIELSAILWLLMGWQFVLAEFVGGVVLVFTMALLMRAFAPLPAFEALRTRPSGSPVALADDGDEVYADPRTIAGWREVGRSFVMEWSMLWKDIALGVVIAGLIMIFVPAEWWARLFLQGDGGAQAGSGLWPIIENALLGPIVSVLSFVCSVGNVPLAAVLYHGGITFGGVISFIYADLIIIPIILIYRKQYGARLAAWITVVFYVSMVITGVVVEVAFRALGWIPARARVLADAASGASGSGMALMQGLDPMHFFTINYTFWLNLMFSVLAAGLLYLSRSGAGTDAGAKQGACCEGE